MDALKERLEKHQSVILRDLDLNKQLMTLLTKAEIVNITDCVQLQQIKDRAERNRTFLTTLLSKQDDGLYIKFIDSLHAAGQWKVADKLVDISEEMQMLNNMQVHLNGQLKHMSDFLKTEERRAGIYLTEPQMDEDEGGAAMSETDVWAKVQDSIQRSQQLLTRCQNVISKLHKDCETVARQNADIVEYTKECDNRIKEVLNAGRHSAKQRSVPKKTQDIFENLMNDIEKLVKTRKKVLTKETEGRRHSTRIIRQCRDWVSGRALALQKLNAPPAKGAGRPDALANGETTTGNLQKEAPPDNNNAIMSILESLQVLEKDLQNYVHQEVALSDKYRAELRRKHLQKQVHGFNLHGFEDMQNALKTIQKKPENMADSIAVLESSVNEINKEYGQCVMFINKIVPENSENVDPSPRPDKKDSRPTPRQAKPGAGSKQNKPYDTHSVDRTAPNMLLHKLQILVDKYEEMKSEDHLLSSKHRIEMSKRKRDTDILMQKKDDQIIKLQTSMKELEAEKEKYKKLYNDTKIGYQKNTHDPNMHSPL